MRRCSWPGDHQLMIDYHDNEYGVPVQDDDIIFERLMLEIYQAGLSWRLVLEKREAFNDAFYKYNLQKVARMSDELLETQMNNPEIIRNRLKILVTRHNARVALELIEEQGTFLGYLKQLEYQIEGDPKEEYKAVAKRMKKDGFKFIGPLILDEFFKSIGLVEVDHEKSCFLHISNRNL